MHSSLSHRAIRSPLALAVALALPAVGHAQYFNAGDLIVSGTSYQDVGQVSTISAGSLLAASTAGGAYTTATAGGSFSSVFLNAGADGSFGVTSQVFLQDVNASSGNVNAQYNLDPNLAVTSFSSKSELSLNVSSDGTALTFMGYTPTQSFSSTGTGGVAAVTTGGTNNLGLLDISNSSTPGLVDPTNGVNAQAYRTVVQLNFGSMTVSSTGTAGVYNITGGAQATETNAYSGNNGRGAVLMNGQYYMVGNAGNSGTGVSTTTLGQLSQNTGVQTIAAGSSSPNSTVVGACPTGAATATGWQCGYNVTQNGLAADKTGKDDNFRGVAVYNGTMYVSKGSGSNGVDTVYQVGNYQNPSSATISVASGFPANSAKTATLGYNGAPFGIWLANSSTMYVGYEGDGTEASTTTGVSTGSSGSMGGLAKYSLTGGTWSFDYMIQSGLGTFSSAAVAGGDGIFYDDGLRNITGQVNANGTVTIYGVTSTVTDTSVSKNWDQGANPNQIVALTDTLSNTTAATGESFSVVESAASGTVLRGVALAPVVPEPSSYVLLLLGLGVFGAVVRRRKAS